MESPLNQEASGAETTFITKLILKGCFVHPAKAYFAGIES